MPAQIKGGRDPVAAGVERLVSGTDLSAENEEGLVWCVYLMSGSFNSPLLLVQSHCHTLDAKGRG